MWRKSQAGKLANVTRWTSVVFQGTPFSPPVIAGRHTMSEILLSKTLSNHKMQKQELKIFFRRTAECPYVSGKLLDTSRICCWSQCDYLDMLALIYSTLVRFNPENKKTHHPLQWIPFGYGPRHCIGMRLANFVIKMALVRLFQSYRIVPNSKTVSQGAMC